MADHPEPTAEIRAVLARLNDGYARRDLSALDDFMALFAEDEVVEFIATGGSAPGRGTWQLGSAAVRRLVRSDWDYWGSIQVEVEQARIHVLGEAAWLSAPATVRTDDVTCEFLGDKEHQGGAVPSLSPQGRRIKPLRLTAVLVRREARWQFAQLHLSFSIRSLPV